MATRKLAEHHELSQLDQRFNRILADKKLADYLQDGVEDVSSIQTEYNELPTNNGLPELAALNQWIDRHITSKGWKKIRTALRNNNYIVDADLTAVSMQRKAAQALSQCNKKLGINDMTKTVLFLAELADQHLKELEK